MRRIGRLVTGPVRVEVDDDDDLPPPPDPSLDDDAEHGRGMIIVDAVCSDWSVLDTAAGKTVWFEIPAQP